MIREIYSDRLLIGNAMDARDLRLLYDNRVAAVVDLALNEAPAQLSRELIYCRIPIIDGDGNPSPLIRTAVRCVTTLIESGLRTLVACGAGMSRSPAIAAAALALHTKATPDECLAAITSNAPRDVSPTLWSRVKDAYHEIVQMEADVATGRGGAMRSAGADVDADLDS